MTAAPAARRKGIVLAGGTGSRLHPVTQGVSKQLLPVYDKPMIYYPLTTLMLAGVREILVITTPQERERFTQLLGDGSRWGIALSYADQPAPEGIAQALLIARRFLDGAPCALVLGDNIFYGHDLVATLRTACAREDRSTIFTYRVNDPERYGVIVRDAQGRVTDIVEKPSRAPTNLAVTGLYFYDGEASDRAATLRPSARGELEITDLNRLYLQDGRLDVAELGRGIAWLDTGTYDSLLAASQFIATLEARQGLKVACPEEVAWRLGWIGDELLREQAAAYARSGYGDYLLRLLEEGGARP